MTRRRWILLLPSLLTVLLATGAQAFAQTTAASATLTAGTLTIAPPATIAFSSTLSGYDQTVNSGAQVFGVTDATGSGAGWNVTVTSTTLQTATTPVHSLSNTSLTVNGDTTSATATTAPAAACALLILCTLPTNSVTYPLTIPAGSTAPTPISFYTAAVNSGMGAVNLSPVFWLAIPGNSYAGSYTSTITFTIASGP